jgi:hypothetical protein
VRTRPGEELIAGVVPDRGPTLYLTSSADHSLEPAGRSLRAFLEQELSASSSAAPPAPARGG